MMTYRDICFCLASNKHCCKETGLAMCTNKKCPRHASTIPDNLPPDMLFAWSDFHEKCGKYEVKKNETQEKRE